MDAPDSTDSPDAQPDAQPEATPAFERPVGHGQSQGAALHDDVQTRPPDIPTAEEVFRRLGAGPAAPVAFPAAPFEFSDHHDHRDQEEAEVNSPGTDRSSVSSPNGRQEPFLKASNGSSSRIEDLIVVTTGSSEPRFYPFPSGDSGAGFELGSWQDVTTPWAVANPPGSIRPPTVSQSPIARPGLLNSQDYHLLTQENHTGSRPSETRTMQQYPTSLPENGRALSFPPAQSRSASTATSAEAQGPPCTTWLLDDIDILLAENFCHVPRISDEVYQAISDFFLKRRTEFPQSSAECLVLPSLHMLDTFIQLYFEYFHPQIPILHLPTYNPRKESWILALAVATVGCQHSAISNQIDRGGILRDLLFSAISSKVSGVLAELPKARMVCLLPFRLQADTASMEI